MPNREKPKARPTRLNVVVILSNRLCVSIFPSFHFATFMRLHQVETTSAEHCYSSPRDFSGSRLGASFMPTIYDPLLVPVHQKLMHRMDSSGYPYEILDIRISVPAESEPIYGRSPRAAPMKFTNAALDSRQPFFQTEILIQIPNRNEFRMPSTFCQRDSASAPTQQCHS